MSYIALSVLLFSSLAQAAYFPELLCVTTPMKVGTKIFQIKHDKNAYNLEIKASEVIDFDENGFTVQRPLGQVNDVTPKKVYGERFELKSSIGYLEIKAHYGGGKYFSAGKANRLECSDLE